MIVYNINCGHPLRLRQNEHNMRSVRLEGYEKKRADTALYFQPDDCCETLIPLTDNGEFTVQINITRDWGKFKGQIAEIKSETVNGTTTRTIIDESKLFTYEIAKSNIIYDEKEVTDPSLELVWGQLHDLYVEVQTKLQNGEFKGAKGDDGTSPTVSVSKTGKVTTVTITDVDGTHTATINDGNNGNPGADGYAPTVSINKVGKVTTVTITDKNGNHTATINDGADGSDASVTAQSIANALGYTPANPSDIPEAYDDTEIKETLNEKVSDVKINGTSVLDADKVANIPIASATKLGVGKSNPNNGVYVNGDTWSVNSASTAVIDARSSAFKPITPNNLPYAVKSAMSSTTDPAWTADQQKNACARLGAKHEGEWVLKGTISGNADDRGNIDSGCSVDLTGCTELIVKGTVSASSGSNLQCNHEGGVDNIISGYAANGSRTTFACFSEILGNIVSISASYTNGLNTNYTSTSFPNNTIKDKMCNITRIRFGAASAITSCNIEIYAR